MELEGGAKCGPRGRIRLQLPPKKRNNRRCKERSRGEVQTTSCASFEGFASCELDAYTSTAVDDAFTQAGCSSEFADGQHLCKYLPDDVTIGEADSAMLLASIRKMVPKFNATPKEDAAHQIQSSWETKSSKASLWSELSGESNDGNLERRQRQRKEKRIAGNIARLLHSGAAGAEAAAAGAAHWWRGAAKAKQMTPVVTLTPEEVNPQAEYREALEAADNEVGRQHHQQRHLLEQQQDDAQTSTTWSRQTSPAASTCSAQKAGNSTDGKAIRQKSNDERQGSKARSLSKESSSKMQSKLKPQRKPCIDHWRDLQPSGASRLLSANKEFMWATAANELRTQVQRLTNRKLRTRIKAFDKRYLHSVDPRLAGTLLGSKDGDDNSPSQHTKAVVDHQAHNHSAHSKKMDDPDHPPSHQQRIEAQLASLEFQTKETQLEYSVVRCSSHRPECPGTELTKPAGQGRWETAPLHVRNEYIVIELQGGKAATVTSLLFTVPGNDASPRQCRVAYSTHAADGPWREAFRFEVKSKEEHVYKVVPNYHGHMEEFKELLERQCGSIEDAWHLVLDTNGDGRLSFVEFHAACNRLKQIREVAKQKPQCFEDMQALFQAIDSDMSGTIGLEDLQRKEHKLPEATHWKLTIVNNWGSTLSTALVAPLMLMTIVKEEYGGVSTLRGRMKGRWSCTGREEIDIITAFNLCNLGVSEETLRLRAMAAEYDLPVNVVEDIFQKFELVDTNQSGKIERAEFDDMILKLHGARDPSDMPPTRLQFFWSQADRDGNGLIDFEEFLLWFSRYFSFAPGSKFSPGAYYSGFGGAAARSNLVSSRFEHHLQQRRRSSSVDHVHLGS